MRAATTTGRDAAPPAAGVECVHQLVEAAAARFPTRLAVSGSDMELSYRERERGASGMPRCLLSLGVGPDDRVGVHLERCALAMVAMLAAW